MKPLIPAWRSEFVWPVIVLILLARLAVAAVAPISFDEAYYWLWSKHLAAGYYDHPPLIAFLVRAGTSVFGDSSLGIRAGALLFSFASVWAVWRAGAILLESATAAASAALLFTLMPMSAIEGVVATPDAPEMAASAFLLYALAKLKQTGDGRWWIAAGIAGGVAALSKYTAFFLAAGILFWLALSRPDRRWFRSPWPYVGAAIAVGMFAPVVVWNAEHGWMSFALQFGRVATGGLTLRYLAEFLGGQLVMATPFVAILAAAGFFLILRSRKAIEGPIGLAACLMAPSVAYFIVHALHDRVQGNWPSFLYPALAIAAAAATERFATKGWSMRLIVWSRRLAAPVAAFVTFLIYVQAVWGPIPLREPVGRLIGGGMDRVAADIESLQSFTGAKTVVTTAYPIAAWLTFYLPGHPGVIQLNERYRWINQPAPPPSAFQGPLLYVTNVRNDESRDLTRRFGEVKHLAQIARYRGPAVIDEYAVYELREPKGDVLAYGR